MAAEDRAQSRLGRRRRDRGDTVNVASRLEGSSLPGHIHIPEALATTRSGRYRVEPRGSIDIKGKGPMATWFLVGRNEPGLAGTAGP